MPGKCRMAGRFRVEKTGADLIVLCAGDAGHQGGDHGDAAGRTWSQTTEVGERAASDLDLDAIRQRLGYVGFGTAIGPTLTRIVHEDVPALLAEVGRLKAEREQERKRIVAWMRNYGQSRFNVMNVAVLADLIERGEFDDRAAGDE